MSSSFLGVSVYLLEWFLSIVGLPQGDFKTATWCLEIASGATRAATQRIDGHKKNTPTLCTSQWCFFWRTHDPQYDYSQWSWLFVFCCISFPIWGCMIWQPWNLRRDNPESPEFPQRWLFRATAPFAGGPAVPKTLRAQAGRMRFPDP